MARKKKTPRQIMIENLDKLASQIVKARDVYCQLCGKNSRLGAHHIIGRTKTNTRWELDNLILLCSGCHIFKAHKNYETFRKFIVERIGEKRLEELYQKSEEVGVKIDLQKVEEGLKRHTIAGLLGGAQGTD